MVEDVGSSNGTWVDGERIEGAVALTTKSQVVIGDYEVALKPAPRAGPKTRAQDRAKGGAGPRGGGKGEQPRTTRVLSSVKPAPGAGLAKRATPGRAAGPQLRGLSGAVTGKVFALSGTMTVGRVPGNDLTVDDDSVSRKHAELEVRGRVVLLRDLGSANGTAVNGAPLEEQATLAAGDIVQFGSVELMFETGAPSARSGAAVQRAPDRPGRGAALRRARELDDDDDEPGREAESGPPMDPKRKRLVLILGSLVGLGFVGVLAWAFNASPDQGDRTSGRPIRQGSVKRPVSDDPAQQIEDLLIECQSYSSPEVNKPDWKRAAIACEKILDLEPIHGDAHALLKRIQVDKACQENLDEGSALVGSGQLEMAVEAFAKVGAKDGECPVYALRALAAAKEPVAEVKKLSGRDCKEYSANGKWDNAYKRCELYMRLACQMMDDSELYAPALLKVKLDGPLGKSDWRPRDPLYVDFLKARERVKPGEPTWRCPVIPAFRPPAPPADLSKAVREEFAKRFRDPGMGLALVRYFDGQPDWVLPLQKIRENMSKANEHDEAKALMDDIGLAQNQLKNGQTEITNEMPERAEVPFRKALEVDEKLVLGDRRSKLDEAGRRKELERRTSLLRRTIIDDMGKSCYKKGKNAADRKDFPGACRIWKVGLSFNRAYSDLLRAATNVCTPRADELLKRAQGCDQLKQVLDFAVDGDGLKQQAMARMDEAGCTTE
jgi:pSer/pThr/pTyr-binding forkhead associated (FHA) protein